jgi:hypothetical protein
MNLKFIGLIAEERPMNTNLMNTNTNRYKPKTFDLHGLEGISDNTIDLHLSLYEGYVKEHQPSVSRVNKASHEEQCLREQPGLCGAKAPFRLRV